MKELNITLEIIAAYKAWMKTIDDSKNSECTYALCGKVKHGSKETRKAEKAAHSKFIKAVAEAGNTGDWDVDKIASKLSSQPEGIAYMF